MIGGADKNGFESSTLWKFNFQDYKWQMLSSGAIKPRRDHTMVFLGNYLCIFGGRRSNEILSDMKFFDLELSKWHSRDRFGFEDHPGMRYNHFSFFYKDCYYLMGGTDDEIFFSDLWRFDLSTLV